MSSADTMPLPCAEERSLAQHLDELMASGRVRREDAHFMLIA